MGVSAVSAAGASQCSGCHWSALWVLVSAVGIGLCCGCWSVPCVLVSAMGICQCCGCWSVPYVLVSAVGVGQRCGCWSVLWVHDGSQDTELT